VKGRPRSFWGKLASNPERWHPLNAHCADVAACCEALLTSGLTGQRLATLAGLGSLPQQLIARLSVLAGLHDIGKFNHGFQAKSDPTSQETAGHVGEALALLEARSLWQDRLVDAIAVRRMVEWFNNERDLVSYLKAVFSHHGRLQEAANFQRSYWQPKNGLDPFVGMASLRDDLERWFPEAWKAGGDTLPTRPEFQHAFFGLVTLADWIASDTTFFPFAEEGDPDRIEIARRQARQAVSDLRLDLLAGSPNERPPAAEAVLANRTPRPLQQAVLDLPTPPAGTITVLEAETGAGKTEAALLYWLSLFDVGLVGGMYFALPTRSAATQLHTRITEGVRRVFPDPEKRPPVVLAVPGYLRVDGQEGQRLAPFEVLWPDSPLERDRHRGWAAENPKRFLVGAVVVGTIDQVLLSALRVRHAHMRSAALLRHLLVVDEVHASDLYMNRLLETVLQRHMEAGGHALLMSATLGGEARARLLAAANGIGPVKPADVDVPFDSALSTPYPLLTRRSRRVDPSLIRFEGVGAAKNVIVEIHDLINVPETVASLGLGAAHQGAKVLILRNTVTDCIATQMALEKQANEQDHDDLLHRVHGKPAPHHARYARIDRNLLDEAIERCLGGPREPGGRVAVATQTVQQSLDLDADLLITDLCPMDVLLQRIGRLHRHQRSRPAGFELPRVIVLVPEERDLGRMINDRSGEAHGGHGLGTVYSDLRVVEATWRELQSHTMLKIPDENRQLIEATVHSGILRGIVAELGGPWPAHEIHLLGRDVAHTQAARFNTSDWATDFVDARPFAAANIDERVNTRLGEGDRRLVFDEAVPGPFGARITELRLPHWLIRDLDEEATPSDVATQADRLEFRFGARPFVYDRLGLRVRGDEQVISREER